MLHTSLHAAACALDPEFWGDLRGYLGLPGSSSSGAGAAARPKPAADEPRPAADIDEWDMGSDDLMTSEGTEEAVEIEEPGAAPPVVQHEVAAGLYEVLRILIPDKEQHRIAMLQLSDYINRRGQFSYLTNPDLWNAAKDLPAYRWWSDEAMRYAPELARVACRIVAASCSTKYSERNWSLFGWIHCKRRNRLSAAKANDLVFIASNMRLLHRRQKLAEQGKEDVALAWTHCADDGVEEDEMTEQSEEMVELVVVD